MARYFCHFRLDGLLFEDDHGFPAGSDPEAIEVVRAIAHVMLEGDSQAGHAMVELRSEAGDLILTSSLHGLVGSHQ